MTWGEEDHREHPMTSGKVQARVRARERTAAARKAQREREHAEDRASEEYELARLRRDRLLADVAAVEAEMGQWILTLFTLGNKSDAVAVMTGEGPGEVKRLKALTESGKAEDATTHTAAEVERRSPTATPAPVDPESHRGTDGARTGAGGGSVAR